MTNKNALAHLGREHSMSRGSTQVDRPGRPSLSAANGADSFPILGLRDNPTAFPVLARGGFSPSAHQGDFQSEIPSPCGTPAWLLVPVNAVLHRLWWAV